MLLRYFLISDGLGRTLPRTRVSSLYILLVLNLALHTWFVPPVSADLDLWTKIKLIGLLALTNKISVVPIPLPIPIPIHLEGKEEVIYVNAHPPISHAYLPSPSYHYSHARYGHGKSHGHHQNMHSDAVGYASEIVPIVASSNVRYGDRISPINAAPNSASNAPAIAPRPIHRQRVQRIRNQARAQPKLPMPTTTTTTPAPPPSTTALQVVDEYAYPQLYDLKHQNDPIVPPKTSDSYDSLNPPNNPASIQSQLPVQGPKESTLSENLLDYIRQVQQQQGVPSRVNTSNSNENSAVINANPSPVNEQIDKQIELDKLRESLSSSNAPSEQPTFVEKSVTSSQVPSSLPNKLTTLNDQRLQRPVLTQVNFPSTNLNIQTPIQSQWQQNFQHTLQHSNNQYPVSNDYVPYKPPELKVIRTRYNPEAQKQEQTAYRNTNSAMVPLKQLNVNQPVSTSTLAQQQQSKPQHTQFLYSVSHSYTPPSTSYFSGTQYPVVDNFGLDAFNQLQTKQSTSTRPTHLSSLSTAASWQMPKWSKPSEVYNKGKLFNSFSTRLSNLF